MIAVGLKPYVRAELACYLDAARAFAGSDDTLPMLTGVQLRLEGNRLLLSATDRYALCELSFELDDVRGKAGRRSWLLYGGHVSDAVRILSDRRYSRYDDARLGLYATGQVSVHCFGAGIVQRFTTLDSTFPPVAELFAQGEAKAKPISRIALNPYYLAKLQKIAGPEDPVVLRTTRDKAGRPDMLIWESEMGRGLIMPVRERG